MAKLSDLKVGSNRKVLVYGNSGAGKTCFIASAPAPIYVFDTDGKVSSAAAFLSEKDPGKLTQIEYDSFTPNAASGGLDVFRALEQRLVALEALAKAGDFKFKTVAIDSLTTFTDIKMQLIMRENRGLKRYAEGVPCLQDYSILISHFIPLMSRILALPCHVICTAHIKTEKNEATGEIVYRPMLPGQLPEKLPIIFQEIYRAFVERKDDQVAHAAQTRSDARYDCRTEIRGIPQYIPLSWKTLEKYSETPAPQKGA